MIDLAFAADAPAGPAGGALPQILMLGSIFVIFYFLLIRPQQKKAKEHQAFLSNLQKGDKVVTGGGLHGEITGINDKVVTLEIAEGLRVKVSRPHILGSISTMTAEKEAGKGG